MVGIILSFKIGYSGAYKIATASFDVEPDTKLKIHPNTSSVSKIKVGEKRAISKIMSFVIGE